MSFQQGLSGISASSKNLEIIGNNIANANSYGSKMARGEFGDVYAAALNGTGTNSVGIGTNLECVAQLFTQGTITTTSNPMDLAINGAGFFQVSDGNSPMQYTRNGQFKVDRDGYLVTNDRRKLMGYQVNDSGVIQPGIAVPLQLPTGEVTPNPTTLVNVGLNLDASKAITLPSDGTTINFADAATYNNATSLTVYDAKGQSIALTYYFQKANTDIWNVYATANGVSVAGDNTSPVAVTTLTFPESGIAPSDPLGPVFFDVPPTTNAAGAATLRVPGVKLDLTKATEFGSAFGVSLIKQDGFSSGQLTGITTADNGIITASYSNGQTRPAGQVELANFTNLQGLQPIGNNAWARTYGSGDPITNVPGGGNLGTLQAGALEESNTDLTGELVNMITAQRVYQANAQTIKTQDQVLQTLVNLR
jgi:flagellar hook protein FlgE